jgi:hypothetical protein
MSNVPFLIFSTQWFPAWNRHTLIFTCFDFVVLLSVGSADLGHRCLYSSRPMDFNKRRETSFDRLPANKPEVDGPSSIFLNDRTSPDKPVCMSDLGLQPKEV